MSSFPVLLLYPPSLLLCSPPSPCHIRSGYGTDPGWVWKLSLKDNVNLLRQLDKFFTDLGGDGHYIWGLNFHLENDYSYVINETEYLLQAFGGNPKYLQAVEIGNECDLYSLTTAPYPYRTPTWTPLE